MPPLRWNAEEDELLCQLIADHGAKWSLIASRMSTGKTSKQCRRRWINYLNIELKRGAWTPEEDALLIEGHTRYGNKWAEIAKLVGGRTENAAKNRWDALLRQQQRNGVPDQRNWPQEPAPRHLVAPAQRHHVEMNLESLADGSEASHTYTHSGKRPRADLPVFQGTPSASCARAKPYSRDVYETDDVTAPRTQRLRVQHLSAFDQDDLPPLNNKWHNVASACGLWCPHGSQNVLSQFPESISPGAYKPPESWSGLEDVIPDAPETAHDMALPALAAVRELDQAEGEQLNATEVAFAMVAACIGKPHSEIMDCIKWKRLLVQQMHGLGGADLGELGVEEIIAPPDEAMTSVKTGPTMIKLEMNRNEEPC